MMRVLRGWLLRLLGVLNKDGSEREISEEIQSHLQLHIDDNLKAGIDPAEARRRALISLGGVEATKERWRDQRAIPWVESLFRDVGYALRILGRNKGWTAVIVVSLALGIGINTALFSVIDSVYLETLNVPQPGRLVVFGWSGEMNLLGSLNGYGYLAPGPNGERREASLPFAVFEAFRASQSPLLEEVFAFRPARVSSEGDNPMSVRLVSGNYYRALGVVPVQGRLLGESDDLPGARPTAVISEEYWDRAFGSDPSAIASSVVLDGIEFEVVGVVPKGLGNLERPLEPTPDVSVAMAMDSLFPEHQDDRNPGVWRHLVMGRARSGVSPAEIRAYFTPIFEQAAGEDTLRGNRPPDDLQFPALEVRSGSRGVYEPQSDLMRSVSILSLVFAIVLVSVCINLANLLLSRAEFREKELAVRLSMGASRYRVVRQLLTESLVLAALGGAVGAILAFAAVPFIPLDDVRMDATVLVFTGAVICVCGFMCGIAAALRSTRLSPDAAMKQGTGRATRSRTLVGKALIVAQVALSLVLVVGGGLLVRTVLNLRSEPTGFEPDDLVLFGVSIDTGASPMAIFMDPGLSQRLHTATLNVLTGIRSMPGVQSAARASQALLSGTRGAASIYLQGQDPGAPASTPRMDVSDGFFDTLGIPLRLGRSFTPEDYAAGARVAVVSEAFARAFVGAGREADLLGRMFSDSERSPPHTEIVGIVGDVKYSSLREPPPPMVYVAAGSTGFPASNFMVRTTQPLETLVPELRTIASRADPDATVVNVQTQRSAIANTYSEERRMASIAAAFGGLVLTVSMVGLFGLMSYAVARRTREFGIRMALGAPGEAIRKSVLRESLILVSVGIIPGVVAAVAATRVIETTLFGLGPNDPVTILGAAVSMLVVSALAAYLPARRASRVDPITALRHE